MNAINDKEGGKAESTYSNNSNIDEENEDDYDSLPVSHDDVDAALETSNNYKHDDSDYYYQIYNNDLPFGYNDTNTKNNNNDTILLDFLLTKSNDNKFDIKHGVVLYNKINHQSLVYVAKGSSYNVNTIINNIMRPLKGYIDHVIIMCQALVQSCAQEGDNDNSVVTKRNISYDKYNVIIGEEDLTKKNASNTFLINDDNDDDKNWNQLNKTMHNKFNWLIIKL